MKKFFQVIGMIGLISFSFFFTEKTATVVKEQDEIMITIKKENVNYKKPAVDALIEGNTIVPGRNGKEIDESKSYNNMKKVGSFSPSLLEYKTVTPNISYRNHFNKYIIGGNKSKNMVGLVFLLDENSKLDSILTLLKEKKVNATFFIDGTWLEKNNSQLDQLVGEGHTLGNLSYGKDYQDSSFVWMNTVIKKIMKQKNSYCYVEKEDSSVLDSCTLQKNYTILPDIVPKEQPYRTIKEKLKSGSIIALPITSEVMQELPSMINFITSKGYQITSLDSLFSEE